MSTPFVASVCLVCVLLTPAGKPSFPVSFTTNGAVPIPLTVTTVPVVNREPEFRLGNAASPFGWSTVVGDFNTDGKPDVAVADHVVPHAGGYAYRLAFSVSGQAPHDVTFESTRDAITLRVADVDRDNDLDVIVGAPLSGETVGVWLNDGHGHFTAGKMPKAAASIAPVQSVETTDPGVRIAAFESSPRRVDEGMTPLVRAPPARSTSRSIRSQSIVARSTVTLSRTQPRAPPAFLHDLLF